MQGESLQADPSTMGDVELERNLEQLFATINELEQSPTNVPLLRRNLELATECGIHEQVVVGRRCLPKRLDALQVRRLTLCVYVLAADLLDRL